MAGKTVIFHIYDKNHYAENSHKRKKMRPRKSEKSEETKKEGAPKQKLINTPIWGDWGDDTDYGDLIFDK